MNEWMRKNGQIEKKKDDTSDRDTNDNIEI